MSASGDVSVVMHKADVDSSTVPALPDLTKQRRTSLADSMKRRPAPPDYDPSLPSCHVNMDLEVTAINVPTQTFTIKGFVVRPPLSLYLSLSLCRSLSLARERTNTPRFPHPLTHTPPCPTPQQRFCFDIEHTTTKKLRIKTRDMKSGDSTELSEVAMGWTYNVELYEIAGAYLPVNQKFMFYNSRKETTLYVDIFKSNVNGRDCVALNYSVECDMMQGFDLSMYPLDQQYLGLKLNARNPRFNFVRSPEEARKLVHESMHGWLARPFFVRLAYSMAGYHLVGAFVDVQPIEALASRDSPSPKWGKPLYYGVVQRSSSYHYRTFIIPMSLVQCSALLILLMPPYSQEPPYYNAFASRVRMILTLFLSLVGMKYILVNRLPESEDETIIERYAKYMFVSLWIISIETACLYLFAPVGGDEPAVDPLYNDVGGFQVNVVDLAFGIVLVIFLLWVQVRFIWASHHQDLRLNDKVYKPWRVMDEEDDFFVLRWWHAYLPWGRGTAPLQLKRLQDQFVGREASTKLGVKVADEQRPDFGLYEGATS